jgi:DNA-directed RNA polymerase specialized sigma24 family protein
MRFLLYCPYEEIAQALQCAEATARVHVTRGLSRLRDLLAHLKPSAILEKES